MKKNKGTMQFSKNGKHTDFFKLNGKVNYLDKSRRHFRERCGNQKTKRQP